MSEEQTAFDRARQPQFEMLVEMNPDKDPVELIEILALSAVANMADKLAHAAVILKTSPDAGIQERAIEVTEVVGIMMALLDQVDPKNLRNTISREGLKTAYNRGAALLSEERANAEIQRVDPNLLDGLVI